MFDMTRPCKTCPFRTDRPAFGFHPDRLAEILTADAFQCHATVDYDAWEDGGDKAGAKPQQCAGRIAMLHREGVADQITQVAMRLLGYDPGKIKNDNVYPSRAACADANQKECGR
jgi:hypothetical protein